MSTERKKAVIDTDICLGCGVCAGNCAKKAIEMKRRPIQVITPVNSTHPFRAAGHREGHSAEPDF